MLFVLSLSLVVTLLKRRGRARTDTLPLGADAARATARP